MNNLSRMSQITPPINPNDLIRLNENISSLSSGDLISNQFINISLPFTAPTYGIVLIVKYSGPGWTRYLLYNETMNIATSKILGGNWTIGAWVLARPNDIIKDINPSGAWVRVCFCPMERLI